VTGTNAFTELSRDTVTLTSQDTDGSGDIDVTFGGLRQIEDAASVDVQVQGGYVANVQSVSGNTATVRIFESAGSNAAMSAVTSSVSLTLEGEAWGS